MIAQLVRFGAVGIAAMLVHWSVFVALVPLGISASIANVIGFCVAFNVSFWGHHHWTFASKQGWMQSFKRFLPVALLSFAVNALMLEYLLKYTVIKYWAAEAIVLIAVAGLTFVISRLWAFRH